MQIIDGGMIAYAAWHALRRKVGWPLTYQVPRMLRPMIADAADTYVLCWNGTRLWKQQRWPAYRDRPEIWQEAECEDFATMLRVLAALGAVQFRTEHIEADEAIAALAHRFEGKETIVVHSDDKDFFQLLSGSTRMQGRVRGTVRHSDVKRILGVTPAYVVDFLALAGDKVDGVPRIVPPSVARALIESRGHVRDWIDRDLRVDEKIKRKIDDNRGQLRLNLELVDLSEDAVSRHGAPGEALVQDWGEAGVLQAVSEQAAVAWLAKGDVAEEYEVLRTWGSRTRGRLGV